MSSDTHVRNMALRRIKNAIRSHVIPDDVTLCFVLSYPRSDMGKGTLIAQLLATIEHADAIKFDGLLNTNDNGRHTAPGHDDFGIYERFNPKRSWGREHYILGGELYRDFINQYGELENLRIQQHLSLYLEERICHMWKAVDKPRVLFIEVGGVLTDPEVEPIVVPLIQRMQHSRPSTEIILLTESGYNGEHIKTKTVQDGLTMLLAHSITPTIIAAREPESLQGVSPIDRIEFERAIINRIDDNLGRSFHKVISVPFFQPNNMEAYASFVAHRIAPMLTWEGEKERRIVIGTKNQAKYKDFQLYLGDEYQVTQCDTDLSVEIPEGMHSLEENAIAKARAWSILTGSVAIADDTGFFIEALNGEPGVATRRWGGELPETADNQTFWELLQSKTRDLSNTSSYVEQCVAIAAPNGKVCVVYNKTHGYLDKAKLKRPYNGSGYPLAAAFVATERTKSWDEMSDDEKITFDHAFIARLKGALEDIRLK